MGIDGFYEQFDVRRMGAASITGNRARGVKPFGGCLTSIRAHGDSGRDIPFVGLVLA